MARRRGHGEGSVYKRGERYAYLLPRHLIAPGERGYRGGFRTRREAQDALREAITAAQNGSFVKRSVDTLQAYAEDVFLPKEKAHRRSSTYAMYEARLKLHVFPHLGAEGLQAITPMSLQRLWAQLLSGTADRRPLSPRSVRIIYTIVRKLFADAEAQGLVQRNPAPASNPPSREAAEPPAREVWTPQQIQRFLDHVRVAERFPDETPAIELRACRTCSRSLPTTMFAREPRGRDGLKPNCRECFGAKRRENGARGGELQIRVDHDSLYPLLWLAARTGMRRGELCGLRWCDVDLEDGILHVRQQYANDGAGVYQFTELKTARARRSIPLDAETVSVLQRHRAIQLRRRMALGPAYASDLDVVFAQADGRPLSPGLLTRRFTALAKGAGLPPIKLHGLRHSVATIASERDLAAASMLLGHYDPAFTAKQYVHPDVERMRRLQDLLA